MKLVSWNTTLRCNLYCDHCYRDSSIDSPRIGELTTKEGKNFYKGPRRLALGW